MWDWCSWTTRETVNRSGRMARRTALKPEDKRLLARLRGQQWTADALRWVLAHPDPQAPTLAVQALHAELIKAPTAA